MSHNETFVSWLQPAYTMEKELVQILEAHRDQAAGYPDVQKRISEHVKETKGHEERIEKCLRELDEEPSHVAGAWSDFKGALKGAASGLVPDGIVVNGITDYSVEHFEMAAYSALITAAEELGHPEIAKVCREIKEEEREMADWLEEHLPETVTSLLSEKAASDEE